MALRKSLVFKSTVFIASTLFIILSPFFLNLKSYFNPSVIKQWLTELGGWAPVIDMLIMAKAVIGSPIPSLHLDVAAGAAFGPLLGNLYSIIGALGGAIVCFMITCILGRESMEPYGDALFFNSKIERYNLFYMRKFLHHSSDHLNKIDCRY